MRAFVIGLLAVLLLATSACAGETGGDAAGADAGAAAELPSWLERVYPAPGQELATAADVQVDHDVVAPDESIRLLIDDVDVTTYAEEGRGELVYDPDRPMAPAQAAPGAAEDHAEPTEGGAPVPDPPAELSPGSHSATVQRLRVDAETGTVEETLDEFTWDFRIQ